MIDASTKNDRCACGHERKDHHSNEAKCLPCEPEDTCCDGFDLDFDRLEADAKAEWENRAFDAGKEAKK